MRDFAWVMLALPLASFLVLALVPLPRTAAAVIAPGATWAAFAFALCVLAAVHGSTLDERTAKAGLDGWTFVDAGRFHFDLSLYVDQLASYMTLIVTGIGALILTYATGYMDTYEDAAYRRFFAYMSFFVFAMLLLVLADGFFFLLMGWGLVGLASYLLIGFDRERPAAVTAARKAFVMNAIGDVGLGLAAFWLFWELGTLDYVGVFASSGSLSEWQVTGVCLLLLVAAVAKSGQMPLHTWLPDAMEGPTPVSALIHAATMVTAGVYLIVRCAPLYEQAPGAQDAVIIVGTVTLVYASLCALAQVDLKRALAYSTVAQIGYMFVAAGLGAYGAAMFHLMTHAFFKALLFLTAGSVIHALDGEQSLDRMGGLRRHMPQIATLFLIGAAALAGLPLLSGYFSKDEITAMALDSGGPATVSWLLMIVSAGITAIYSFRLYLRVFTGEEPEGMPHPHGEGGLPMRLPLYVLGAGALAAGFVQVPDVTQRVNDWIDPAVFDLARHDPPASVALTSLIIGGVVSILGALWATRIWRGGGNEGAQRWQRRRPAAYATLANAFYFNELYDALFVRPASALGRWLRTGGERLVGEGLARGGGGLVLALGERARDTQRGLVRVSGSVFVVGVCGVVLYALIKGNG
jgi:NADH-quinone oxidoreductase subunit L